MAIKDQFFEFFTRELVMNSLDPWERKIIEEKREKIQRLKKEMEKLMQEKMNFAPKKIENQQNQISTNNYIPQTQVNYSQEVDQQEETEQQFAGLNQIEQLIANPTIAVVECPGPGRFVLIKKGFKKLATKITLNKDEIEEILNYFSNESRIPRIGGVFKAIVDNLILTAIDSPYGGPKFIITKTRING
jgi:hypothetical protein